MPVNGPGLVLITPIVISWQKLLIDWHDDHRARQLDRPALEFPQSRSAVIGLMPIAEKLLLFCFFSIILLFALNFFNVFRAFEGIYSK